MDLNNSKSPKTLPLPNLPLRAGIFRHSVFLASERFIPDQALALPTVKPLVLCRDEVVSAIDKLETRSLAEYGRIAAYRHTLIGDPRPLARLIREADVDIVHAHFGVEGLYASRATARLNLPQVTTLHGFDVTVSQGNLVKSRRPAWLQYAVGRAKFLSGDSHFVCVSEHIRRLAIQAGANEDHCSVIGTGVASELITPSPRPDQPIVLHVARLVEKKGTEYLIRAFAVVIRKIPEAQLRIVGEGPLRAELEALTKELGIGPSVEFLGAMPHGMVLEHIHACSVFSLPSVTAASGDQEGLGQVVLEAAAAGRPVVATRHGGLLEAVEHGKTGILVEERNVAELADALVYVLNSQAAAMRFGQAGRNMVLQKFDLRKQAAKIERLYRNVLAGRSH